MIPTFPKMFFDNRFIDYSIGEKEKKEEKKKEKPPKKYQPRPLTQQEIHEIKERKKRYDAHNRFQYYNDDYEAEGEKNQKILDDILKNQPHSEKICIHDDGDDQFAYKVVYRNGDGQKPQKGMGIKMYFRTQLFDGTPVHSQFSSPIIDQPVGRKRLAPLYDTLGMNVTSGEIGTIVVTTKYGYGDRGNFPLIPPYATMKTDYWCVQVKQKEYWEITEVQKCEQIEILVEEIKEDLELFKSEPDMDPVKKREMVLWDLFYIRLNEDRLYFSYVPRADNLRKRVCAYEVFLVYHLGQKILCLELMDKYFELEGRNVDDIYELLPDYVVEDEIYKLKIELEFQLGLFDEIEKDIKKIQDNNHRKFKGKFTEHLPAWKQRISDYEALPPQEKNNMQIEFSKRKDEFLNEDQKNAPTENWIYNVKGYRPDDPLNKVQPVQLNSTVPYDKIVEWVIGEDKMELHKQRLKDGWFHKIEWDRERKYQRDLENFLREEDERKEEAKMNNEPFEEGFFVYKNKDETWEEYDARRRQEELWYKFFKVHRQYGEKYKDFCIRRAKIEKEQEEEKKYGLREVSALQKKLQAKMKKGFVTGELPKMPRQQAYKVFDID